MMEFKAKVSVVDESIDENGMTEAQQLERLEQLGFNLDKQIGSSNTNKNDRITQIYTQDVDESTIFLDVLDYR